VSLIVGIAGHQDHSPAVAPHMRFTRFFDLDGLGGAEGIRSPDLCSAIAVPVAGWRLRRFVDDC
jgi:hypothetical protein